MGFILVSGILASMYLLLQLYYIFHWSEVKPLIQPQESHPLTGISIIIVARNAERTIGETINSLLQQNYPAGLFEILIIDDRSDASFRRLIESFASPLIKYFRLSDHPSFIHAPAFKKSGIELGVHYSKYDFIAVTDADCILPPDWLRSIASAREQAQADFLTGPVLFHGPDTSLVRMQQIENLSLMLITASGIRSGLHDMANGANMAFSKKAFQLVQGYEGNYQYASGDDMFLIEKMRKHFPVAFIKSDKAIVMTGAKTTWHALIKQRVRWAGKNKGLENPVIRYIWLFIGGYHIMMLLFGFLSLFNILFLMCFGIMLLVKWVADYLMVIGAAGFFGFRLRIIDFIVSEVLYGRYVIWLGLNMLFGRKGDW